MHGEEIVCVCLLMFKVNKEKANQPNSILSSYGGTKLASYRGNGNVSMNRLYYYNGQVCPAHPTKFGSDTENVGNLHTL